VVDGENPGRRVIEQQHDLSKQTVTRAQIDNASAAESPPDSACDLPGFEEFFPRQAPGGADRPRDSIEVRVRREASEIVAGQTGF
jgi:hypothetical protein